MAVIKVCAEDDPACTERADILVLLAHVCDECKRLGLVRFWGDEQVEIEELRDVSGRALLKLSKRVIDVDAGLIHMCVEFMSEDLYEAVRLARHLHDLRDILQYYVLQRDPQASLDLSALC